VRIEVVCSEDLAARIARQVSARYYEDYAMILFESDIQVLRPDKFS